MKYFTKLRDAFWITNISKRIVSLTDLALAVKPMTSVNLMDAKRYSFNKEQLLKSAESGSIFAKKDKIVVRLLPPGVKKKTLIPFKEDAMFPSKPRSAIEVEKIKYEELELTDEDFAKENSDIAEQDHLGKWKNK